jgi:hypothetical protein
MALDRPAYGNVYGYEGTRYNQARPASMMRVTANLTLSKQEAKSL